MRVVNVRVWREYRFVFLIIIIIGFNKTDSVNYKMGEENLTIKNSMTKKTMTQTINLDKIDRTILPNPELLKKLQIQILMRVFLKKINLKNLQKIIKKLKKKKTMK